MKSNRFKISCALATAMFIATCMFLACVKDPLDTTHQTDADALTNLFKNFAPSVSYASIANSEGGEVRGNGGSRLIIQPNSFRYANGSPVTGNVDIAFTDYSNRADMIFSNILPVSYGDPLISGGEYHTSATQNGVSVYLAAGKMTQVNIPQFGKNSIDMIFFRGEAIDSNGVIVGMNWGKPDSSGNGYVVFNGDTISIFDDRLGYANADKYLSNPVYCQFKINALGVEVDNSSFVSYCMYKEYNGLWPIQVTGSNTLHATHIPTIPVHLVVFGYKDDQFYAGTMINYMPVDNATVDLTLQKSDPLTLKNFLKNL